MKLSAIFVLAIGLLALARYSCMRDAGLKGQSNTRISFHGKVVDEHGTAMAGAKFTFRIEAYPKDWTFDSRGRENDVELCTIESDANGRFRLEAVGCTARLMDAKATGYRHFYDKDVADGGVRNQYFHFIAWSDLTYKNDFDNPAVYVFVKDAARETSALPSRGGWDSPNGLKWFQNKPKWPRTPSLTDVVHTSQATTRTSA